MLDGDGAFCGEGLDFLGAVIFPIADVGVVADAEGAALGKRRRVNWVEVFERGC